MIPEEFEYLFEENDYEFYKFEEYGFSYSKLALHHKLYEDFGHHYTSTFLDIFENQIYDDRKISQIWIFHQQKPIGLGMAIHYLELPSFIDKKNELSTTSVGHIQLYVKPTHRKKGLATKMVPELEKSLLNIDTTYPASVILQDKAYLFKEYLTQLIALPHGEDDYPKRNVEYLYDAFKNIGSNTDYYYYLKDNFPLVIQKIHQLRKNHSESKENVVSSSNSII